MLFPRLLVPGFLLLSGVARAAINYTCDPSVATATCSYLNSTIAGQYGSTFTNANAKIYITYGSTGLAQTEYAFNVTSYSAYVAALNANANKSAEQVAALSALSTYDSAPYSGGNVNITASLASALNLTGANLNRGVSPGSQNTCSTFNSGCYNAIVTVTNNPNVPLYYDNLGGTEPANAYDFYAAVEHETDEVLGTSSCISTGGSSLSDQCNSFGTGTPSAVDLFRYSAPGALILDSSLSTASGQYFSYNGGNTNGANGFFYNTQSNGTDYADFLNSCPGGPLSVQDARGCPGVDKGINITNDGGAEINILNAVGFDEVVATPEPRLLWLLGSGLGLLAFRKYRRRMVSHAARI